jgi:phospholipid/cholesterol/gamma-HCH transport system ATP-binding protein
MRNDAVITVRDLTTGYGEQMIHERVSFEVRRGEIFVIVGASGCGKSTLLRHLIGLQEPLGGDVWLDGENLTASRGAARARILRKFGVLFQSGALLGSLTLAENIELLLDEYTALPPATKDMITRIKLGLVNLRGFENHLPSQISGGMKKRAGLARAMALDPLLLFFDEPSAGLDPISSAELDRLIVQLNASLGTTMVIVTHELASIFAVAHRVIMLDKDSKGIVAEGTPAALRDHASDPVVRAFFNRTLVAGSS